MRNKKAVTILLDVIPTSVQFIAIVVFALIGIFVFFNLPVAFGLKAVTVSVFLILCLAASIYVLTRRKQSAFEHGSDSSILSSTVEEKLQAFDDTSTFFSSSLKPKESFSLVANRILEVLPADTCVLYVEDETKTNLRVSYVIGEHIGHFVDVVIACNKGLAGKAYLGRSPIIDHGAVFDKQVFPDKDLSDIRSAMAVPLARNGLSNYGVIALYSSKAKAFTQDSAKLFDAIASRISQLFLSSFALERNLASANMDSLTKLPNERAFFVVIENRIAESIRYKERRPLSVLSIDIAGFSQINDEYGFATGDRALVFVANRLRQLLRRMDFVARIVADEFFIVLPTATAETAEEIKGRIVDVFELDAFDVAPKRTMKIKLNYGIATLFKDGNNSGEIMKTANERRLRAKLPPKPVVVEFPRPYAN